MKIGFVGAGNMASAFIHGLIGGGVDRADLAAFDVNASKLLTLQKTGIAVYHSLADIASAFDYLLIAVKPKDCYSVLSELKHLSWHGNLVSIVTGWPQERLSQALPCANGIIRMMPNTPAQVQEAVLAINTNHTMKAPHIQEIKDLFSKCGKFIEISESLFEAVTAISGSGPAYVYLFIEAMADAGVREGLPRDIAYALSAQTLRGAATMVLKTGKHPGALKDDVCSPAGTTIEAIVMLDKLSFRSAVMDAVHVCAEKAVSLAKQHEGEQS